MVWADFAGLAPRMDRTSLKEGWFPIPGSLLIDARAGWRKYIPDSSRLRGCEKGLERVRRKTAGFSTWWFHPENLYAGVAAA